MNNNIKFLNSKKKNNSSPDFFGNHNKIKRDKSILSSRQRNPLLFARPGKYVYNNKTGRVDFGGFKGPYGDRDFDGSPNKFDCSPNDMRKDGKFADTLKNLKEKIVGGKSSGSQIKDIAQKELPKVKRQAGLKGFYQTITESPQTRVQRFQESYRLARVKNELNASGNRIENVKNKFNKREIELMELKSNRLQDLNNTAAAYKKRIAEAETPKDRRIYEKRLAEIQDKKALDELKFNNRFNKLEDRKEKGIKSAQGKSGKTLSDLRKLQVSAMRQERIQGLRNQSQVKKLVSNVGGAFTPAGTFPAQYQTIKSTRSPRGTYARPGRPAGVYKYSIPGKGPVHVYEWRKWVRQQRALLRSNGNLPSQQAAVSQVQRRYQVQPNQPMQYPSQKGTVARTQVYQPTQQEMQQAAAEEAYYAQNNPELQAQYDDQLPPDNKFVRQLQFAQGTYQRDRVDRMRNEQPADFLRRIKALKEANIEEAHNFEIRNALLNAHKQMLSPQENAINFLDTQNNLLDTRYNNIMARRSDSIDILNTNRPNILQASGYQDDGSMNPLNAGRLNFGKINLTSHPDESS